MKTCHNVPESPGSDYGSCDWDECPMLTDRVCALPPPPRTVSISPGELSALDRLVVGSMCHCDDPDDCFDHWQFFIVDDPATAMRDGEHVGQGRTLTEAQMRHVAGVVAAASNGAES